MFSENISRGLQPALPVASPAALPGDTERQATLTELFPYYLAYATHELRYSRDTIESYRNSLRQVLLITGDITPQRIGREHVLLIKSRHAERAIGPAGTRAVLAALKSFLKFCQLVLGIETIDPKTIRSPKMPKREVEYLTADEVRQFVSAIPIRKSPRAFDMRGLCFRALVEVLLGTGMRISEALSLKRTSIDLATGEATIIGKGNKQRTVFFSPRALNWVKEYLTRRTDGEEALFLATGNKPLTRPTAVTWFGRFRRATGFPKKVTAHMLRHTVATTLLFNGCPIGHIKEILGHEHLITTCRYYLGTDKRAARNAQRRFLDYEEPVEGGDELPATRKGAGAE